MVTVCTVSENFECRIILFHMYFISLDIIYTSWYDKWLTIATFFTFIRWMIILLTFLSGATRRMEGAIII